MSRKYAHNSNQLHRPQHFEYVETTEEIWLIRLMLFFDIKNLENRRSSCINKQN